MSVNIVNILAIYDINTLLGRGQARDSVCPLVSFGGVYKVFEREGGNLKRIGTADENLNILKK